jgi:hypothetical protein
MGDAILKRLLGGLAEVQPTSRDDISMLGVQGMNTLLGTCQQKDILGDTFEKDGGISCT